jgi:hypothetical protein
VKSLPWLRGAIVAAGLFLVVVPAATAGPFAVSFQRAAARPGQSVVATGVIVWPDAYQYTPSVIAYLIPTRLGHADYNTGLSVLPKPGSHGTYRLGPVGVRNNRVFLRFTVPRVPPGNYTASVLWGAPWTGKPGMVIRITR